MTTRALALGLFFLAACSSDPGSSSTASSSASTSSAGGCTKSAECKAGDLCVKGVCGPNICTDDSMCPSDERCDFGEGACIPFVCSIQADCPDGDVCANGVCAAP